jgi:hypothetical protein
MRFATIIFLLLLSACQPTPVEDSALEASVANSEAAADPARLEAVTPAKIPPKPKAKAIELTDSDDAEEVAPSKPNLCWQDYCPCEETIAPLDRTICRELKAGREVSDDQFSIGAMARDLKVAGDASNAAMDDAMAETRKARAELHATQRSGAALTDN